MLDKKILFHFLYAISLIGLLMACFGMITEVFHYAQLYNIESTVSFWGKDFWFTLSFYYVTTLIMVAIVTMAVLYLLGKLSKVDTHRLNVGIAIACGVMLLLSLVLIYCLLSYRSTDRLGVLSSYDYLNNYTLRSAVGTFLANAAIQVFCGIWERNYKKATAATNTP